MRFFYTPASLLLTLVLTVMMAACSSIETRPGDIATFAAGDYKYYKWRSEPMQNTTNSQDPMYAMDPIVRKQLNKQLAAKGYVLDEARAQFSVDYIFAAGMRMGERSAEASNISLYPSVNPNRQTNQAVVDNAYALGGVKETSNIALQFNDEISKREVWQVIITKIVENVNKVDTKEMKNGLKEGIQQALKTLPNAT